MNAFDPCSQCPGMDTGFQQYNQPYPPQYGPQYGMPGNQQYGMPGNQQYGMPGNQQYGMPGNQPCGMPGNQQYGMPGNQPCGMPGNQQYGMPGNQPCGMPGNQQCGQQYGMPGKPCGQDGDNSGPTNEMCDNSQPIPDEFNQFPPYLQQQFPKIDEIEVPDDDDCTAETQQPQSGYTNCCPPPPEYDCTTTTCPTNYDLCDCDIPLPEEYQIKPIPIRKKKKKPDPIVGLWCGSDECGLKQILQPENPLTKCKPLAKWNSVPIPPGTCCYRQDQVIFQMSQDNETAAIDAPTYYKVGGDLEGAPQCVKLSKVDDRPELDPDNDSFILTINKKDSKGNPAKLQVMVKTPREKDTAPCMTEKSVQAAPVKGPEKGKKGKGGKGGKKKKK